MSVTKKISTGDYSIFTASNANVTISSNSVVTSGNLTVLQNLYIGPTANAIPFTNPILIGIDSGAGYVQAAIVNTFGNASADFTAYSNNGNDTQGWMDMGMTGNVFNDSRYTITGFNDGYIFANGVTGNSSLGGNLVIATGSGGATNDIVFAAGGFLAANEKFRWQTATNTLLPYSNITANLGDSTHYFNNAYVSNITIAGISGKQYTTITTNTSTTSATLSNIGLNFGTVNGATYEIKAMLFFQHSAATTNTHSFTVRSGNGSGNFIVKQQTSNSSVFTQATISANSALATATTAEAGITRTATIEGSFIATGSGTNTLQFSTNGGNLTIVPGSYIVATRIA